jgi:hypothetical protein
MPLNSDPANIDYRLPTTAPHPLFSAKTPSSGYASPTFTLQPIPTS